eukprot:6209799-Pleurochrysis_carterae.AAC.4
MRTDALRIYVCVRRAVPRGDVSCLVVRTRVCGLMCARVHLIARVCDCARVAAPAQYCVRLRGDSPASSVFCVLLFVCASERARTRICAGPCVCMRVRMRQSCPTSQDKRLNSDTLVLNIYLLQ